MIPSRKIPTSIPPSRNINPNVFKSKFGVGVWICKVEHLPAFRNEVEMNEYFAKYCPGMDKQREWKCEHCGWWHRAHYPLEITGQSSGKKTRKVTIGNDKEVEYTEEML